MTLRMAYEDVGPSWHGLTLMMASTISVSRTSSYICLIISLTSCMIMLPVGTIIMIMGRCCISRLVGNKAMSVMQ